MGGGKSVFGARILTAAAKNKGQLIRRSPLTESSFIVHWCTVESGIVKTVARGARRARSAFKGRLDLFYEAEIELLRSRSGGDLHTLRDVAVLNPRFGIRESYARTAGASYFVQLLELVVEPEAPIPAIHDLLRRALDFLNANEPTLKAVLHFESELARDLGIGRKGVAGIEAISEVHKTVPRQRAEVLRLLKGST